MTRLPASSFPLVAVDVGNSRVKLGLFETLSGSSVFPEPSRSATVGPELEPKSIEDWLVDNHTRTWLIASVERTTASRLVERLGEIGPRKVRMLQAADLPLEVEVPEPDHVGIDRLVNAVAANALRQPARGAIVIDIGSAITIDAVSAAGAFLGGAILPGIGMLARALHEFTDLLPLSEMNEIRDAPEPLGKNTIAALRSGLFWGAVGAMREITTRLGARLPNPQLFLTGGAAPSVAEFLVGISGEQACFVPHLTLAGIAISARSLT